MYDDNINIDHNTVLCAFCMKEKDEVDYLIAGQFCFICDQCIDICNKILFNNIYYKNKCNVSYIENDYDKYNKKNRNKFLYGLLKPREIYEYLDKYVMGQNAAKKALSLAVYNHFKRLKFNLVYGFNLPKSNMIIIGPSGSGKTFLMQTLSKLLNVPFAIADATTLTEAGYVGEDVENILQRLFQDSDFDLEKTEMGIVYIDEIDKIAKKPSENGGNRDVSGEGVQQALLKLIEGTITSVCMGGNRRNPNQNFVNINTENILFICGGAFYGLDKIISEKSQRPTLGFRSIMSEKKTSSNKFLKIFDSSDLVKFGLIPELIGRLPVITLLEELNLNTLMNILNNSDNSIVSQYNILLSPENIILEIDDEAVEIISKMAYDKKTGARGLKNIVDSILSDTMYEAPSLNTLRKIIIHKYIFDEDSDGPLLVHLNN